MTGSVAGDKPILVCADDYGIAPGVSAAIRALVAARRLSATSCMVVGPWWDEEAPRLRPFEGSLDIGLHFTLTDLAPLGPMPDLAPAGRLPPLRTLIRRALLGRLDPGEIACELERQIDHFVALMGCEPAFLDGHQHVHQLPVVRDAVVDVFCRRLQPKGAWMRFPAGSRADLFRHRTAFVRALAINMLGLGFRRRCRVRGIPGNTGFRGVRGFVNEAPYPRLMARFLKGIDRGGLIMCHPGIADAALRAIDPVTTSREEEFAFLSSDAFPALLGAHGCRLARFCEL
jgi:hypothetical protein